MSRANGNGQKFLARRQTKTVVLTDRQSVFVATYLNTGNASEAARQAGFNWPGQKGAKLLKTAKIRAAIDAAIEPDPFASLHVHAALSELAFANLGEFIDDDGLPVVEKIRASGHMVKKYKAKVIRSLSSNQVTVTNVQIELHDRQKRRVFESMTSEGVSLRYK